MNSMDQLASEALLLPKDQRYTLANRILASVEPDKDVSVDSAWDSEIRERIARYDAGLITAIPGSSVLSELDEKLRK
jgi:putative addiction module component (TIGR02574 family)